MSAAVTLPADRLAYLAKVDDLIRRERRLANRHAVVLAADIAALRAASEVLGRQGLGWPSTRNDLDRQAEKLEDQLAEIAA